MGYGAVEKSIGGVETMSNEILLGNDERKGSAGFPWMTKVV